MKAIKICARCGSANLLWDAFVHVNDPEDVRVFDDMFCEGCCSTNQGYRDVVVEDDFDIYSDNVFELTGE